MGLWDIILNAAGGGVLGSALHCVTDYFDTKNKIMMLKAQMDAASQTSAWSAFQESQKDSGLKELPAATPVWVVSTYVLVEAFKNVMRPLLALVSILIIAGVYASLPPDGRNAMMSEVTFGCFTAVFWYFGARYSRSSK